MKLRTLAAAVTLALGASLPAHAIIVTDNNTATDLVNAIIGTGITVQGAPTLTFNTDKPAGTFTGGAGSVGFDSGIVLTTGTTDCVAGPNDENGCTGGGTTTSLKFDFTSTSNQVFFQYVFGSEEYNTFVNSNFNDSFQLLLNGTNIAVLPGGSTPVEINTVNCLTNPGFFRNNVSGESNTPAGCTNLGLDIQYDGLTAVLTATANLNPGTNTFEFLIFDRGDSSLDSGVFIQGGSFCSVNCGGNTVPEPGSMALAGLGLLTLAGLRRRKGKVA